MDQREVQMHLAAGEFYGVAPTCGSKRRLSAEDVAVRYAASLNSSGKARHEVEAYPCPFCSPDITRDRYMWHVGRVMTAEEREMFSAPRDESVSDE